MLHILKCTFKKNILILVIFSTEIFVVNNVFFMCGVVPHFFYIILDMKGCICRSTKCQMDPFMSVDRIHIVYNYYYIETESL